VIGATIFNMKEVKFEIIVKPKAEKDLRSVHKSDIKNILESISDLKYGLSSNIKHLTNFTPEYRLRVGNYRILFEIEENKIVVYRIIHRKEAYKRK
jgi:mRNA interferase RelE/StbE